MIPINPNSPKIQFTRTQPAQAAPASTDLAMTSGLADQATTAAQTPENPGFLTGQQDLMAQGPMQQMQQKRIDTHLQSMPSMSNIAFVNEMATDVLKKEFPHLSQNNMNDVAALATSRAFVDN